MELSFEGRICNDIRGEFRCGVANRVARWVCDFKKSRVITITAPHSVRFFILRGAYRRILIRTNVTTCKNFKKKVERCITNFSQANLPRGSENTTRK